MDINTAGNVVLFVGGARSGKSDLAEKIAAEHERVAYIATAQAVDDEMAERIRKHRKSRPQHWTTFEIETTLSECLQTACEKADAVIVDCLTVYVARRMEITPDDSEIIDEVVRAMLIAKRSGTTVILVSNEVGMGIVPEYPSARRYRDVLGIVNQRVAEIADKVLFTIAGIPVDLKALQNR